MEKLQEEVLKRSMNRQQIIEMQKRIGVTPDGFWGPRSIAACQAHLRQLRPSTSIFPSTSQAALQGFFGSPGDESQLVNLNCIEYGVRYDSQPVRSIRCHHKVANSLERILAGLADIPAGRDVLTRYAGCYNNRPMRGGSLPSLHARGAAIDLDPDTNRNKQAWPASATMPLEVMEIFAAEGWVCAGSAWGRDAMHFQATV
jgi:hypothetical protein